MEPESHSPPLDATQPEPLELIPQVRDLEWVLNGTQGLRSGWSVFIFLVLFLLSLLALGTGTQLITQNFPQIKFDQFTPASAFLQEFIGLLSLIGAAAAVAHIEGRHILNYNLIGPRPAFHFFTGLVAGFAALSALIAAIAWHGALTFGPLALSGKQIIPYAALWGAAFLVTALFEEGAFRCFLQFTLTRGINFWWALGIIAVLCFDLLLRSKGTAVWGVYAAALLGVLPCLLLHLKKSSAAGFWQAAWVTSTLFGFTHTGNGGENWIGVFAAAAIGFVFCVTVRLTGSAWWAIGFHAAWDWAETYFYGTADSGNVATGHYLTTTPAGAALWSGGTDGPEGSLLILPLLGLLVIAILAVYGRRKISTTASDAIVR